MWNKIRRYMQVCYDTVSSGPALTLCAFLLTCVGGINTGYAGSTALVEGEVQESSCDVNILNDDGNPVSQYVEQIENQTVSKLELGGVYGLSLFTLELSDCMGVVADSKYAQTVGVEVTGTTVNSNAALFRNSGVSASNDADPGFGFAITTKDPGGTEMAWSTTDIVSNHQVVSSGKSVVQLHNNATAGEKTTIPLWMGMSCGDSASCSGITTTVGGSLEADIMFTFAYK